jgi:hypothetical protein
LSVQEYDQPIVVVEPIFAQSSKSREPRKINPKDKTKVKVITITKPPVQVQADKTVGIINTNIPPKVKEKVIIDGQKIVNAPVPTTQFKRGMGSGERGFLILIFQNFDNHGKGDLLPWIMNLWIL